MKDILYISKEERMSRLSGKFVILNDIPELRARKNMTQQELADAVNVTRATIIALEKGSYNPSLELAFRLSKYFRTGIEQIFSTKGA